MIGKIYIYLLTNAVLALFVFSIAEGQLAVSDPTSYSYYVEQLKKMEVQLKTVKETYKTTKDIKDKAETYRSFLSKSYRKAQSLIRKIDRMKKKLEDRPDGSLEKQARYWNSLAKKGLKVTNDTESVYVNTKEILNRTYRDPRLHEERKKIVNELDRQYETRQLAVQDSIIKSEEVLKDNREKIKNLKRLSREVNNAKNMKEASDVQNLLLAEILTVVTEQLDLWAHIGQAQGLMNFSGVDEEVTKIKKANLDKARDPRDKSIHRIEIEERIGKDITEMTTEDLIGLIVPQKIKQ